MLKLEQRPQASKFWTYGSPILALLITVLVGVCLFALLGKDPVKGLQAFFWEPIRSGYALGELAVKATPLLLIALGLAVCFRSNVWNIGAEGQFVMGAIAAGGVALLADKNTGAWIVPVVLAVLGGVVLYMALQIHKYTTKDPVKRAQLKPLDPQKAFGTLVACKALGLAGAALAGWYGGQIIMSLPHGEAEFYSQAIIECVVACVVCVADMIVGIVGEWLCRIPPIDGPESPAVKKAAQRNRYAAAATKASTKSATNPATKSKV